jgi:hypothetical protein
VKDIASNNGVDTVFVNGRGILHDVRVAFRVLITGNDSRLIWQSYLGVGNNISRKNRMGFIAVSALYAADVETDSTRP